MARLMLSAGMFSAFAAAIAVRSRGFPSGSPPPDLAAIAISLIRRVKILPRLASSAPFLCLIVAHFEWPDMEDLRNQICAQTGTEISRIRMRTNGEYSTRRGSSQRGEDCETRLPRYEDIAASRGDARS